MFRGIRNYSKKNIAGFNASNRKKIKYPNLPSAVRPVFHSDDLPVPIPPANKDILPSSDEEMPTGEDSASSISSESNVSVFSGECSNDPHRITQEDMNDLTRDLYLSKQQLELLAFRLKQWNLVNADVKISSFRAQTGTWLHSLTWKTGYATAQMFLDFSPSFVFHRIPQNWRLFIDSSK
ncbi:UNVERIFIED_CONTAM: hypothetical protein RMT77_002529 [Armadillidium vulgare]